MRFRPGSARHLQKNDTREDHHLASRDKHRKESKNGGPKTKKRAILPKYNPFIFTRPQPRSSLNRSTGSIIYARPSLSWEVATPCWNLSSPTEMFLLVWGRTTSFNLGGGPQEGWRIIASPGLRPSMTSP